MGGRIVLFNSVSFLIYFPLVTALYFLLPHGQRWLLLLGASCIFYMAFVPAYILILAFTIAIDYAAGILIAGATGRARRVFLGASILSNLGVLAVFKYFNFFNENLAGVAAFLGWNYPIGVLEIVLPIGLSFHTFQAMSYTIEVYRGRQAPERHVGIFALYVMFYPQLVAGPIERPQNLLPQFREPHAFQPLEVTAGLQRMLWGMFKKVVIADNLAMLVNPVYANPQEHAGFPLLLATVAFTVQVYCDFSGYADIAVGSARVMGFRLRENFDRPFLSPSLRELWRRWHISLSSWLRDYLYIPLGGSRVSRARCCANLVVVFAVCGLWHGANWTYVVFGVLHGLTLATSVATEGLRARLRTSLRFASDPPGRAAAMVHSAVCTAWTFGFFALSLAVFRASSLSDATFILTRMSFEGGVAYAGYWVGWKKALAVAFVAASLVAASEAIRKNRALRDILLEQPSLVRWPAYAAAAWIMMNYGAVDEIPFFYFQF